MSGLSATRLPIGTVFELGERFYVVRPTASPTNGCEWCAFHKLKTQCALAPKCSTPRVVFVTVEDAVSQALTGKVKL